MIYLLLDSFVTKPQNKKGIIPKIIVMLIPLIFFCISFCKNIYKFSVKLSIIMAISLASFFIILYFFEKGNQKNFKKNFEDYNKYLDSLSKILKEFKYDNNSKDWYSKEKIEYLITAYESHIEECHKNNTNILSLGKNVVFPIIAFVSGVIADKSSINDALKLGVFSFLFIIIIYSTGKLFSFVMDLILKSSSEYQMKNILSLLKDLLARDF